MGPRVGRPAAMVGPLSHFSCLVFGQIVSDGGLRVSVPSALLGSPEAAVVSCPLSTCLERPSSAASARVSVASARPPGPSPRVLSGWRSSSRPLPACLVAGGRALAVLSGWRPAALRTPLAADARGLSRGRGRPPQRIPGLSGPMWGPHACTRLWSRRAQRVVLCRREGRPCMLGSAPGAFDGTPWLLDRFLMQLDSYPTSHFEHHQDNLRHLANRAWAWAAPCLDGDWGRPWALSPGS